VSSTKKAQVVSKTFRLKPLMVALALFSPLQAFAVETPTAPNETQQQDLQSHSFHRDHIIGTSLDVVVTGVSKAEAKIALAAIQTEIADLEQKLSVWRADSEISQLNANKTAQVSPELYEVLAACENWRSATCGAFDARLGQLIALWENAQGVMVPDEQLRVAITNQLDPNSVQLDEVNAKVQLSSDVSIAPDAYAKGYIIDRAMLAARKTVPSIEGLLIDIGGDMRVWGSAPQKSGWKVGVQDAFNHHDLAVPSQVLHLTDHAVAFSGKGYRSLNAQSHLLDPKTGLPLEHVEQCVVVGTCAADADALATALAAMPADEGMQLIEALVGYEAQLTLSNGDQFQSSGWNGLAQQHSTTPDFQTVAAGSSAKWPSGYQAMIDLTIPKLNVETYRAPYVSVWVTDENKKLVRTLAVWGKHEKWINSNYVWWRRYGRQMEHLDAVAKPSRQPGHYKLAWDGKDDAGRAVSAGKYLIHIETSREHGGHSYQTLDLNVSAKGSSKHLPAQTEIGNVTVNFQKAR
jgi:FAD:protein FMN transferase